MKKNQLIIKTAITTTLALSVVGTAHAFKSKDELTKDSALYVKNGLERCAGRVKAALNDCPTSQHACAGFAMEDGDYEEYIWLPVGTCEKIAGTHLRTVKSKTGEKNKAKMK